ncbi:MAG: hypothetical protein WC924_03885 [Candidatus Gracilibacteria bacterium]
MSGNNHGGGERLDRFCNNRPALDRKAENRSIRDSVERLGVAGMEGMSDEEKSYAQSRLKIQAQTREAATRVVTAPRVIKVAAPREDFPRPSSSSASTRGGSSNDWDWSREERW